MIGSPLQLTIILAIVLVLFGAKKLRNIGGDIGGAIKNFRNSMRSEGGEEGKDAKPEATAEGKPVEQQASGFVIDAEVVKEKDKVS